MALLLGVTQGSYRKTADRFNRLRRQTKGGTPLNTLRDAAEREGNQVLEHLEAATERILHEQGFSKEGAIQPVSAAPQARPDSDPAPDYLPARRLNEFVYCPRLYFYEHVEGVFVHNRETVEGSLRHAKVDSGKGKLPPADDLPADATIHSRSVTLSSDRYEVIAKMDLIEAADGEATPVDYKRGSPRTDNQTGELEVWDADREQLVVQGLVLRDNGYRCEEGVVYYVATRQRVRVPIDEQAVAWTLDMLRQA